MTDRFFPILSKPESPLLVPWRMLNEDHAQNNHGQTLKRLAERGGCSETELLDILTGKPWAYHHYRVSKEDAAKRLSLMIANWYEQQIRPNDD